MLPALKSRLTTKFTHQRLVAFVEPHGMNAGNRRKQNLIASGCQVAAIV